MRGLVSPTEFLNSTLRAMAIEAHTEKRFAELSGGTKRKASEFWLLIETIIKSPE